MNGSSAAGGHVVVGAGLAGARAVETLRAEGADGPVVLIGGEEHLPYERPPLSKDYLQGSAERDSVFVHSEQWYRDNDIDLRRGVRATGIDPRAGQLTLDDGSTVAYRALLLATGSTPRRLAVPGADLSGVHVLRTLDDADALREAMAAAERMAVIGAGWIGLEVAAAGRAAGLGVTVLERAELPLLAVLGPEVAATFAELHRDHGVDLRCGVEVAELVGEGGLVTGVRTAAGDAVPADLVVVGVGATPNTALAQAAGLVVDDGIRVDAALRTSAPGIFAAGDVARADHPLLGRAIRVEHWANALHQAPAAARSMLGQDVSYDRLPYFYTDQYDLGMEYIGHVDPDGYDHVVLRGDVPGLEFVALWMSEGRVLAGMTVNIWDTIDVIGDMVRSRRPIETARLRDPTIALDQV